jgi:xanthine dehydrogenase YagS FAD-binding subunit
MWMLLFGEVAANPQARVPRGRDQPHHLMKEDVERPTTLVDLTRLKLADIVPSSAGVSIGALATNSNTANHSFIRRTIRTSRKP